MSQNKTQKNSMKEIVYNGNKIVKYNDGYMTYYLNEDGDVESKSFKSLYKAKCFLNKH